MTKRRERLDAERGIQRRYIEMRFDGERTLTGTALRYGDIAQLPWGERETFQPGAFGAAGGLDVILNRQHDRRVALCRTGGSGLTLDDSDRELAITAVLPDTSECNDTLVQVRERVLRGLSIEFMPTRWRIEKSADRNEDDLVVVEEADLRAIAVVDRPAYPDSTINARYRELQERDREGGSRMDPELRAEIEAMLKAAEPDVAAIQALIEQSSEARTEAAVQEALARAKEAEEQATRERAERKAAEQKAVEDAAELRRRERERAELVVSVRELLPKGTDTSEMTVKDILVMAVGDEVKDAESRSEGYLQAKVEGILERRESAKASPIRTGGPRKPGPVTSDVAAIARTNGHRVLDVSKLACRAVPLTVTGGRDRSAGQ